jgi:type I site-specific restriction endonuclease
VGFHFTSGSKQMPALTPEQEAREQIDEMLEASGWQVQTRQQMNRLAAPGVAACEFPLTTGEKALSLPV